MEVAEDEEVEMQKALAASLDCASRCSRGRMETEGEGEDEEAEMQKALAASLECASRCSRGRMEIEGEGEDEEAKMQKVLEESIPLHWNKNANMAVGAMTFPSSSSTSSSSSSSSSSSWSSLPPPPSLSERTGRKMAEVGVCVICRDEEESLADDPWTDSQCGHGNQIHGKCAKQMLNSTGKCRICNYIYGVLRGTQPANGTMSIRKRSEKLPGFESTSNGTIAIRYEFPSGVQTDEMES